MKRDAMEGLAKTYAILDFKDLKWNGRLKFTF